LKKKKKKVVLCFVPSLVLLELCSQGKIQIRCIHEGFDLLNAKLSLEGTLLASSLSCSTESLMSEVQKYLRPSRLVQPPVSDTLKEEFSCVKDAHISTLRPYTLVEERT